jgi:deoxycytidylate deaminase
MNNSATTRRISKIAVEYNGNDKGTAEMVYYNNLMSENAEHQFLEMKTVAERNAKITNWAMTGYISRRMEYMETFPMNNLSILP